MKSILSSKVQEGDLVVLQNLALDEPKTQRMVEILENLKVGSSVLMVTKETQPAVVKSARNLKKVKTMPAPLLNVVDLLNHKKLVMTVEAVRKAEELWTGPFVRFKNRPSSPLQE